MSKGITYAALDTHKKEHVVAWAHPQTGEVEGFTVRNTAKDITKMVKKLQRQARAIACTQFESWIRCVDMGEIIFVVVAAKVTRRGGDQTRRIFSKFLC